MRKIYIEWASIAKKVTMAIAGLFLAVFLLVHMSINLLMLLEDGGTTFEKAAAFMGNTIIKPFEVILFSAFIVHIITALIVWWHDQRSRPIKYNKVNKSKTSFFSKYIIYTGIVILIFLVLHLNQFWWQKMAYHDHSFYFIAKDMFTSSLLMPIVYVFLFIVLALHLNHAFQAGFQTLGWASDKYTPLVKKISTIYAFIIALGFSTIPITFYIRG